MFGSIINPCHLAPAGFWARPPIELFGELVEFFTGDISSAFHTLKFPTPVSISQPMISPLILECEQLHFPWSFQHVFPSTWIKIALFSSKIKLREFLSHLFLRFCFTVFSQLSPLAFSILLISGLTFSKLKKKNPYNLLLFRGNITKQIKASTMESHSESSNPSCPTSQLDTSGKLYNTSFLKLFSSGNLDHKIVFAS